MANAQRLKQWFYLTDLRIISWMEHHGPFFLRIALGVVFIWFGVLKPLGQSPATQLVSEVTFWIPIPNFPLVLGVWEVAIGVCFLFKPLLRTALLLLFLHMPGTALPFLIVPEKCFTVFPYALTLEGQYIVKNLALVAAALVIGGTIRHRMQGFTPFEPDELTSLLEHGGWGWAEPGETLTRQGEITERMLFIQAGQAVVLVDGEEKARLGASQFVGEMSFLTGQPASATVKAADRLRYISWPAKTLKGLIEAQPSLAKALHAALSQDLIDKLRSNSQSRPSGVVRDG